VRAISDREAARRQARRHDTRQHRTVSSHAEKPLRFSGPAARLELIHQQQVMVEVNAGVIMRGRRGSRFRPPARATGVARRVRRSRVETDAHTDDALLALVRLLARQAAREAFAQAAAESDRSTEEDRE